MRKLNQIQFDNFRYVRRLRKQGFTYKQISNTLNEMGIKPIRVEKFTPQLVFSFEKKMLIREKRMGKIIQPKIYNFGIMF